MFMTSLRVLGLREAWWFPGAAAAVALLALATGLCLFDQDEDGAPDHVMPPDLCLGLLAASLAVMLLTGLLPAGWAVVLPFAALYEVPLYSSDPPPRPDSLLASS